MDKTGEVESRNQGSYFASQNDEEEFESNREAERENKRVCMEKEDRMIGLDDNVLIHILSFLPTKEAIRTCVLSKRWIDLWTRVPCLNFILDPTEFQSMEGFIELVENTMILNKSSKIFKFHLDMLARWRCSINGIQPTVLDRWIRFATDKANVEELSVFAYQNFHTDESTPSRDYLLPRHIFACSSLTKMNLSFCNIVPHGIVTWPLLKSLTIQRTKLSDSVIQNILSGSPALEFLEICECCGLNRLDITGASLRKLVIRNYHQDLRENNTDTNILYRILEIFAPNIQALKLLGRFGAKCRLVDVSSLITADFSFILSGSVDDAYYKEFQNILKSILEAVRDVKELILGCTCFQIVTTLLETINLHSSLPKCKGLTLKGLMMSERELRGLVRLQQKLPSLEMLTIDQSTLQCHKCFLPNYKGDDEMSKLPWGNDIFEQALPCDLKIVKIVSSHLCNEKQITSLVELLLKIATKLETMAIGMSKTSCVVQPAEDNSLANKCYYTENLLKLAQKLLSLPRFSCANIMFSW